MSLSGAGPGGSVHVAQQRSELAGLFHCLVEFTRAIAATHQSLASQRADTVLGVGKRHHDACDGIRGGRGIRHQGS